MPMREECKNFESRSYANGETVRKCNLDLAPEAPWRCPDPCSGFEPRLADVNWKHGSLVTPPTPHEPDAQGVAELLDAAEDIVNDAGPRIPPRSTPNATPAAEGSSTGSAASAAEPGALRQGTMPTDQLFRRVAWPRRDPRGGCSS